MRLAATFLKIKGSWTCSATPEVPFQEQKDSFKKLMKDGAEGVEEAQFWDSGSGRTRRFNPAKVAAKKHGTAKPKATAKKNLSS
jgi:hypothetical protein